MAIANVLMPSLVKLHFPDRIGLVTAIYTTALAIGLTAAFLLTVPIADALGGWRSGLGVWAVARAGRGAPVARPDRPRPAARARRTATSASRDVARTRLGWAMAVFFGLQSLQAYAIFGWFAQLWRDAGFGAGDGRRAGRRRGRRDSIPLSLWLPQLRGPARRPALGARARSSPATRSATSG